MVLNCDGVADGRSCASRLPGMEAPPADNRSVVASAVTPVSAAAIQKPECRPIKVPTQAASGCDPEIQ